MKRLAPLRPGQMPTPKQYDELVARVNALSKITGRNGIVVRPTNNGVSITGSVSTASQLRRAYVKTTPDSASSVVVYLDTDSASGVSPGREVVVQCNIIGGDKLSSAFPVIEDGDWFYVTADTNTDTSGWSNVWPFIASKSC